jgi:hypothetical protein
VAAALARGALQWIRRLAGKRAAWGGFQAARVLTHPLRMLGDREGVFSAQRSPSPHASTTGTTTSQDFRGVHVAFTCLTPLPLTPWYPHDDGGMPLRLPS